MKTTAIDFETYLIGQPDPWPKPVCCSHYNGQPGLWVGMDEMEQGLSAVLEGVTIAHNATFECCVIWTHFPRLRSSLYAALKEGRIICTKINEQLINARRKNPTFKLSLADLVELYFHEDISSTKTDPDAWRLRYSELDGVPISKWPKAAIDYAIDDSIWAWKIHSVQETTEYALSVESEVYLNLMGTHGIHVNTDRVLQLEAEIYEKLIPAYKLLEDRGFCTRLANEKRPKKNMTVLRDYIQATVDKPNLTNKGNIGTDNESLLKYALETEDEVFKAFMSVNTYDKILTAYVANLKSPIIRSQYSAVKSTGRTSSHGSKNYPSVNIQQMPRKVEGVTWDIRNCFIPRPGYKLVSIDYAGLELASTAHQLKQEYGKSKMQETVNSGTSPIDLHSKFATKIASIKLKKQISFEEFVTHKKEKPYCDFRQLAKPINLGFPGGIGYDTMRTLLLQSGVRTKFVVIETAPVENALVPLLWKYKPQEPNIRIARINKSEYALVYDELVGLKQALFDLYPDLADFLRERHKFYMTGDVSFKKNEYGEWEGEEQYKYSCFGFTREWCNYTAFCNGFLMQTPSAVGAKSMVRNLQRKYIDNSEINMLAFIHDEVLFEIKEGREDLIDDVAKIMIESMQSVLSCVRITVEASMMDYWDKGGGDWNRTYWKNPTEEQLYHD